MLTAEIRVQKSSDKENTDKWCTCSSRCKIYVMTPDLNNLITTFNPNKKKGKIIILMVGAFSNRLNVKSWASESKHSTAVYTGPITAALITQNKNVKVNENGVESMCSR